jgi:hypothetical protein
MNTIDITQPPLTSAEIEARQQECQREINTQGKRLRLLIGLVVIVPVVICVAAGCLNEHFALQDWRRFTFYTVVLMIAYIYSFVDSYSTAFIGAIMSVGIYVFDSISSIGDGRVPPTFIDALSMGGLGLMFASIWGAGMGKLGAYASARVERLCEPRDTLKTLDDVNDSEYPRLREWASDDVIATYLQQVVKQGRAPIIAEMDAMLEWWKTRDTRAAKESIVSEAIFARGARACESRETAPRSMSPT